MPSGNGAKAKQRRERVQAQKSVGAAHSQLKTNEKAKTIQCKICKQSFMCTASATEYVIEILL